MARAHEHHVFEINGMKYEVGIGSVGEPVTVDDKSAVELSFTRAGAAPGHEQHHAGTGGGGVTGLEKTLFVELIAGDHRKVLPLKTVWSAPGHYEALFVPTASMPLSYRVFGTIDSIPFDVTFNCKEAHDMTAANTDMTRTDISPGVIRLEKRGAFGCPMPRADLGFPYPAAHTAVLADQSTTDRWLGSGAILLSLCAFVLALRRRSV